ncbi:Predicted Fe-Mo cluster-binding protein, NifX family [Methanococcoides vulcani]|uniref:Predicted Fe-Mo cluster-binding protein, NifX family n=1 Tax=Methanococcoides vulcani TaxID=1353158 RepID=A0A1H9YD87_9EURY|nr:NifB/NifX family molybdenum-iron cluster-binding protein [Methanococcoides vulcani]SES66929.1 Predicted Fe-Mo cluster-binding protein, NifX family [Methanococcoides vulcani]
MKICVTATAGSLDAVVDPRFGRCQYFVIVDSETMEFEALKNPSISAPGGAGVQAAQAIVNKSIDILITGEIGPNALPILSAAGIKVVTRASGSVANAIEQYNKGELQATTGPTEPAYAGMGRGGGMGRGRGRGMGSRR